MCLWWKIHFCIYIFFCKKTKDSTSLQTGLLHPVTIPTSRFTSWSMAFATNFPLAQGCNAIFVCVDCLTKYTRLIPCFMGEDLLIVEPVALLFFQNVVWCFRIPICIIHDGGPRYTSEFWQSLWKLLRSYAIVISAHYFLADSQTEWMNHTIG